MTKELLEKLEKASNEQSFRDGIDWFKKNLWHKLSDIPENGKEVIIKCKDTHDERIFLTQAKIFDNWEKTLDRLSLFRVIEWFYVEDLL